MFKTIQQPFSACLCVYFPPPNGQSTISRGRTRVNRQEEQRQNVQGRKRTTREGESARNGSKRFESARFSDGKNCSEQRRELTGAGAPGARNLPAKHFRPNEKRPAAARRVCPFQRTRADTRSIPRELHQGMRGRNRRTRQFTGPRIIQGQQSIYRRRFIRVIFH